MVGECVGAVVGASEQSPHAYGQNDLRASQCIMPTAAEQSAWSGGVSASHVGPCVGDGVDAVGVDVVGCAVAGCAVGIELGASVHALHSPGQMLMANACEHVSVFTRSAQPDGSGPEAHVGGAVGVDAADPGSTGGPAGTLAVGGDVIFSTVAVAAL